MSQWQAGWNRLATPDHGSLDIFFAEGQSSGPTALITAGIHGDEYEGVAAVAQVARAITPQELHGKIIAVPIANPAAFDAGTRTNPADGRNLARCFPGKLAGSPTERLAAWLFTTLATQVDFAIDLHSGGVDYQFLPLAGFYGEPLPENPSFRAACTFGLPHVWQLPHNEGVLSFELWKRGVVAIGNEYLGAGQLSADGVSAYASGLHKCLQLWGVVGGSPSDTCPQQRVLKGDWLLSEVDGLFYSDVKLGDEVQEGSRLAHIRDLRGSEIATLRAPHVGVIAALRSRSLIRKKEWAVLVAGVSHV